jgi:hypothetical protein
MQQFEQNYINDDNIMTKFNEMSEVFKNLWITYADSQNILYMKKYILLDFYQELSKPLGLGTSDANEGDDIQQQQITK